MIDQRTLARPYAKAVFQLAARQQQLAAWSQVLALLAVIAKDNHIQHLYQDPQVPAEKLAELFISLLNSKNYKEIFYKNFILLLAQYKRLMLLPFIAELFEEDKANLEKTLQVEVSSAFAIAEPLRKKLKQALEIRLQRSVNLQFQQDQQLLGGAIIRAGDLVIDSSVRSKLDRLKQSLLD